MSERDETENWSNWEITYPWCGEEFSESYDYDEDVGEAECGECEKLFNYERYVEVTYNTTRDCEQNADGHDFQFSRHMPKYDNDRWECTKCDRHHYIQHGEEFDISKSIYG